VNKDYYNKYLLATESDEFELRLKVNGTSGPYGRQAYQQTDEKRVYHWKPTGKGLKRKHLKKS